MAMFSCEKSNSLELLIAVKDFHSSSKPSAFSFHKLWKKDSKQFIPVRDVCQFSLLLSEALAVARFQIRLNFTPLSWWYSQPVGICRFSCFLLKRPCFL